MEVNYRTLGRLLKKIFGGNCVVAEDYVAKDIKQDDYAGLLMLEILSLEELHEDDHERVGIRFWLWFCHDEDYRMDFSDLGWETTLEALRELGETIDWSQLVPLKDEDGGINIALFRLFETSAEDLEMAFDRELSSEFLRTLLRIFDEWKRLDHTLSGLSTGQLTSARHLKEFVQPVRAAHAH